MPDFKGELITLLNRYSKENDSNTPDFILANYLLNCLHAFNEASNAREWFNKHLDILGTKDNNGNIIDKP